MGNNNYNKNRVSNTLNSYVRQWELYYYNDWKRFGNNMIEKDESLK